MLSHLDILELSPALSCTVSYCGEIETIGQMTRKLSRTEDVQQVKTLLYLKTKASKYFDGVLD